MKTTIMSLITLTLLQVRSVDGFMPNTATSSSTRLAAAPRRLEDNVEGVLYVNEKCINCAACSNFAPTVFGRAPSDFAHIVHHQPSGDAEELEKARAALSACPVAAIRVETEAQRHHRGLPSLTQEEQELSKSLALSPKVNGLELPFPRPFAENVYYTGHHNEGSFGATPYLSSGMFRGKKVWVMVDTPKFSPAAKRTVTSLTGPEGPDFLFLTHVDDTDDHDKWASEFPNLKRIFHNGDLGRYNWIGDTELENVEVLLKGKDDKGLKKWALDGSDVSPDDDFVIWHTPGHSPGSLSLLRKGSPGVLFTGDTYAYSTRNGGRMSGFPRYNKGGRKLQSETLKLMVEDADVWDMIAPGHGHPRDYRDAADKDSMKNQDLKEAVTELSNW